MRRKTLNFKQAADLIKSLKSFAAIDNLVELSHKKDEILLATTADFINKNPFFPVSPRSCDGAPCTCVSGGSLMMTALQTLTGMTAQWWLLRCVVVVWQLSLVVVVSQVGGVM